MTLNNYAYYIPFDAPRTFEMFATAQQLQDPPYPRTLYLFGSIVCSAFNVAGYSAIMAGRAITTIILIRFGSFKADLYHDATHAIHSFYFSAAMTAQLCRSLFAQTPPPPTPVEVVESVEPVTIAPPPEEEIERQPPVIEPLVKATIKDLKTALIWCIACYWFTRSTDSGQTYAITLAESLPSYIGFRAVSHILESHKLPKAAQAVRWMSAYHLGKFFGTTLTTMVHEFGHCFVTGLITNNPQCQVTLNLYGGAVAHVGGSRFLPSFIASPLISAGGPAMDVTAATLAISEVVNEKSNTMLSRETLVVMALFAIVREFNYALSTFDPAEQTPGHDYKNLWDHGIHPYVAMVAIVALPVIAILYRHGYNQKS